MFAYKKAPSNQHQGNNVAHDYFKSGVNGNGKRKYPIIYNEKYDISLYGLETLHLFNTHKWLKTHQLIKDHFQDDFSSISPVKEVNKSILLLQHSQKYVKDIHESNAMIAQVAEAPILYLLPNFLLKSKILEPFKWHTSGTILASRQAMLQGAAVNLGGGFHHAASCSSSGFCFFADIGIAIHYLWENVSKDLKFFIIDLDAHQGNGHELCKRPLGPFQRKQILTLDMYNKDIFPQDGEAKEFIDYNIEIESGTSSDEYLDKLKEAIKEHRDEIIKFKPNLVIYNAGTDILKGDRLGQLNVTEQGIIMRDELIFRFCKENWFPIVLLMSGGYQMSNAKIVADSIINLIELGLIKPIEENLLSSP